VACSSGLDRCAAGHVVGAPVSRYGWTHVGIAVGVGLGLGWRPAPTSWPRRWSRGHPLQDKGGVMGEFSQGPRKSGTAPTARRKSQATDIGLDFL